MSVKDYFQIRSHSQILRGLEIWRDVSTEPRRVTVLSDFIKCESRYYIKIFYGYD